MNKTLTVFTPAYNRAHTLGRTYDSLCRQTCKDFKWLIVDDGSTDGTRNTVVSWINPATMQPAADGFSGTVLSGDFEIRYIYKENGGLYTGYNTAYANIDTELNVCIDSDDYMPDDAVEKIVNCWKIRGSKKYAGIIGLDFYHMGGAIGGEFPSEMSECYFLDLYVKGIHKADTKEVMRTDLMKQVAPQVGFPGEKNFNPVYMLLKVCDKYPMLLLNENLCFVDYQDDGMAANIFKQYVDSPRSFSKLRILEMQLTRNPMKSKFRSAVHYVSSSILSHDSHWLKNSPHKLLTILAVPFGVALFFLIKIKVK